MNVIKKAIQLKCSTFIFPENENSENLSVIIESFNELDIFVHSDPSHAQSKSLTIYPVILIKL